VYEFSYGMHMCSYILYMGWGLAYDVRVCMDSVVWWHFFCWGFVDQVFILQVHHLGQHNTTNCGNESVHKHFYCVLPQHFVSFVNMKIYTAIEYSERINSFRQYIFYSPHFLGSHSRTALASLS